MSTKRSLIIIAAILALALAACDGDEVINGDGPPPNPSATVAGAPYVTRVAGDGLPEAVAIIDAARRNDAAALEALVRYEPVPCTTTITGIGGPPRCREGEAAGTPVEVVFATTCEGYYAREGELDFVEIAFGVSGNGDALYGVYEIDPASQLARIEAWGGAMYAIVLNRVPPPNLTALQMYAIISNAEAILGTATGCGETPEQWVSNQDLGEPILAP